MPDDPHPSTEELRVDQIARAGEERSRAQDADRPDEQRAHERRADKAAYLAEKLDEQAEALDR